MTDDSQTPSSALADQPHVRVDRDGVAYTLLGTAHVSRASVDAVRAAIASGKPYLIDANIGADKNPSGAGVWELPGHGVSAPVIGGRYTPPS